MFKLLLEIISEVSVLGRKKDMMKKKTLMLLATLTFLIVITSCSAQEIDSDSYAKGYQDAIAQIKDEAQYDYNTYIDLDAVEDILLDQYGACGEGIRDSIVSDVIQYDALDIVTNLISEDVILDY